MQDREFGDQLSIQIEDLATLVAQALD